MYLFLIPTLEIKEAYYITRTETNYTIITIIILSSY